jgi:hypothetical protein
MFRQAQSGDEREADFPEASEYAQNRAGYIQQGKGTPPS